MRVRFGVPIFVSTGKGEAQPELLAPEVTKGAIRMPIRNGGIRQVRFEEVAVVAGERTIAKTAAYRQSRKDRKKVEMLFAHLKRIMKLDRLRLRGLSGAHDEFLLAAAAQNLRRMAKRLFPIEPETANMAI